MTRTYRNIWLCYAAIFAVAQLSITLTRFADRFSWVSLAGVGLQLWFVTGVVAYAFDRPLGKRGIWSTALSIAWIIVGLNTLYLLASIGWGGMGFVLATLIANGVMLYALWAYQQIDHPRWRVGEQGNRDRELLKRIDLSAGSIHLAMRAAQSDGMQRRESVELRQETDLYVVSISIDAGGKVHSSRNEFWSLEAAIAYIEQRTAARAADFMKVDTNQGLEFRKEDS